MRAPCIALLTDFGEADYFVASLKGVMLGINPKAVLVDISHSVPAFDIRAGAFVLAAACRYFPQRTIFLSIVDPGVGSKRKILLVRANRYDFIAPDNGLLSPALARERAWRAWSIENTRYSLPGPSRTFEGRDKMAPAAARLSLGADPASFGPPVGDIMRWNAPEPRVGAAAITGEILYADKYGNLTTNIPGEKLVALAAGAPGGRLEALVGARKIGEPRDNYAAARKGEVFFLVGSLGLVEIAAREASARRKLGAAPGDRVRIARHG